MFERTTKESRVLEEKLYEEVAFEIENNEIKKGLWAKALSESSGNKNEAEALYIKLRIQNIIDEIKEKREDELIQMRKKIRRDHADFTKKIFLIMILGLCFMFAISALS